MVEKVFIFDEVNDAVDNNIFYNFTNNREERYGTVGFWGYVISFLGCRNNGCGLFESFRKNK